MKFPYPENSSNWQTAYTRDDAYRQSGVHARHSNLTLFLGVLPIALFFTIQLSPYLDPIIERYIKKTAASDLAAILLALLLSALVGFVIMAIAQSRALQLAASFFSDFHRPPEGIEPAGLIRYRLNGKSKLPPPFNRLSQFKYIMAKEGEIVKSDQWPAWMARALGGPLLLIVFDGCALYLERGNRFSRVVGPGEKAPFLEWFETIKYVVDLRPKVYSGNFNAWTKDGIKIEISARIECRIGDPKKKDPEGKLVYPYDPDAVQKAIERYAVRWPSCPEGEPTEFTWIDAAWGQVTGIIPGYIGSRMLDDLFIAKRNSGQILSPSAIQETLGKLNSATNGFGVYITDFQISETKLPQEVEKHQREFWQAEKQSATTIIDGQSRAFRIRTREKARADAQYDIILAIAEGLKKNRNGEFTEPVLLSLSGVLDESLREPLTRAYLAKETLDTLEQLRRILDNPDPR